MSGVLAIGLCSFTASAAQDANSADSRVEQALSAPLSFGQSVAIDGDTAVVGAPGGTTPGGGSENSLGAAYVFMRRGETWTETAKLVATGGVPGDGFGHSVAIQGDTLVVGASRPGAAYMFTRANGIWSETAKLTVPDRPEWGIGMPMVLDGDTLAVGNPGVGVNIFTRAADGTWTEAAKLTPADGSVGGFGWSVDLDGNTVVVGADPLPVTKRHVTLGTSARS